MSKAATEPSVAREEESTPSFFSQLVSFVLPTAHAEEPKDDSEEEEKSEEEEAGGEEEEEEEPEDIAPGIREECESTECTGPSKHFKHCAEKIEKGEGWKGEDCVEELFHLMHCVDTCSAPKLFKKLA
ncbi:ubiquinol-cytochrome C reductase hinge domain-containing protein [Naematelia encephala]|uniref:Ubiquinol-cytochrome C reductase hinge domain-containing protein n=1 Tax=Naematelia encephala TaxID=71784 RepID=A0A1Y2AUK2_9TREE|nr:ubiquinol-cytochrome C reductase hinge domain-containing protein [Naematelia encephala]